MAKKKKAKINLPIPDTKIASLTIANPSKLPAYTYYVDSLSHSFRFFFEEPKSVKDVVDEQNPQKTYIRAGKYSRGVKSDVFWIMKDGKDLVGEDIAKKFSQLIIKKLKKLDISPSTANSYNESIIDFFQFIGTLDSKPTCFNELSIVHFSDWLDSLETSTAKRYKSQIATIISLHKDSKKLNLSSIRISTKKSTPKEVNQVDYDKVVAKHDYSDKELIQILAYAFYEIEIAQQHFDGVEQASAKELADDYVSINDLNVKNTTIPRLLESGINGHKKLLKSLYICIKNDKKGIRKNASMADSTWFMQRLKTICSGIYRNRSNPHPDFIKFLHSTTWSIENNSTSKRVPYIRYLSNETAHHELAILLYAIVTTGLNLETVTSWKFNINGKPWYENFDVKLGITEKTTHRDKSIVLVGKKNKGNGAAKSIETAIQVGSPLFKYLIFLDKTRPNNREYIFTISEIHPKLKAFANRYKINNDDGEQLTTITTKKLRKVFAGHELIKLLKDIKNADELISKLKDALNHNQFDTTLFSYILKSGVGNLVINSAIVALTSDLLEQALCFKGQIKEDAQRSVNMRKTFLCDCTDPSSPTHELPIADQCRKYDMCLGCERSEVYAEHLPAICYRIMQYENKKNNDPEIFKATLEDRNQIARDTIEKFKVRHTNGIELVEKAYMTASDAMSNRTPILPPILQAGGK